MRRRFSFSVIALGLSLALLASACSSSDSSRNATFGEAGESAAAAAAPQWLYAVDAADVTVIEDGSGFSVSLPASERVTAFTDRPNRQTDSMTLLEFAEDWEVYGFDTDPPNAALLLETGSQTLTSVVEMTNPRIENGQVIFGLNPIDDPAPVAGNTQTHTLKPATYNHASLFIDATTNDVVTGTGEWTLTEGDTMTFNLPPYAEGWGIQVCNYASLVLKKSSQPNKIVFGTSGVSVLVGEQGWTEDEENATLLNTDMVDCNSSDTSYTVVYTHLAPSNIQSATQHAGATKVKIIHCPNVNWCS
jgi:hypothetical protein